MNILQETMKIAVQSRRLFSSCIRENLRDPATIVIDGYGVQFVVCVGMVVLINATQKETVADLYDKNGVVWARFESSLEIPASKIFQPHHTWIEQ